MVVCALMILTQIFYTASCFLYYFMAAIILEQHSFRVKFVTLETLFFLMNTGLCLSFDLASWLFVGNYWNFALRLNLIAKEKDPKLYENAV